MKAIQELQVWITDNLRKKLSVQVLADRVAMSVGNFERVFTREVDRTPSQYVLQARVEAVRHQVERTDRGLKQIAVACGFGSADVMLARLHAWWEPHLTNIATGYVVTPLTNRLGEMQSLSRAHDFERCCTQNAPN